MPKITLYFEPACSICEAVIKFFKNHNIKITSIDISKNLKAFEELIKKTGLTDAPIVIIEKDGQEHVISV